MKWGYVQESRADEQRQAGISQAALTVLSSSAEFGKLAARVREACAPLQHPQPAAIPQ